MGRLKRLPSRVAALPARVRAQPKRAERFYQSEAWREYRSAHRKWTIARQGGVWCCKCGSTNRLVLDHRAERRDGGEDFPPFDQADWFCAACHNRKTVAERVKRVTG